MGFTVGDMGIDCRWLLFGLLWVFRVTDFVGVWLV